MQFVLSNMILELMVALWSRMAALKGLAVWNLDVWHKYIVSTVYALAIVGRFAMN